MDDNKTLTDDLMRSFGFHEHKDALNNSYWEDLSGTEFYENPTPEEFLFKVKITAIQHYAEKIKDQISDLKATLFM